MSLIAIISDIHGNIDALEAVLEDIDQQNTDIVACLGDIVGYGGAPKDCVERIERLVNREGYTLKGAKAALRGASDQQAAPQEAAAPETPQAADLLRQLEAIRNDLRAALAA